MKLTDDLLRKAAGLAQQQELEEHFSPSDQPLPISDTLLAWMQQLAEQLEQGKVTGAKALLGWHYYVRNTAVAVLIGFLCLTAAAPDAVLAGCQKLIETIETVFEEYTEYRYRSHVPVGTELVPLHPGYLPEGMEDQTERREEDTTELYRVYKSESDYFILHQILLQEDGDVVLGIDTENAEIQTVQIQGMNVELVYKNEMYQFLYMQGPYLISGKTSLDQETLFRILNNLYE